MPLAGDVSEIELGSETVAVHAQLEPVLILKLPVPPPAATLPVFGVRPKVHGGAGVTTRVTSAASTWFAESGDAPASSPENVPGVVSAAGLRFTLMVDEAVPLPDERLAPGIPPIIAGNGNDPDV